MSNEWVGALPDDDGGVLADLLTSPARRASLRHVADVPARAGVTAPWPAWVPPDLSAAYRARGVVQPWCHQVEAAEAVRAGRHTVVATSTGSGKSLALWLPALTAILEADADDGGGSLARMRRRPCVLYLAPTKALAADQLAALEGVLGANATTRRVRVATCDGDTPLDERTWVRSHADVVLTNPDFLHFSLLPGHERWSRVLRGLTHVVLDECHAYRGVFGAHVSLVLRRLLRLARSLGADPVVVAASATTGEPRETLARMIAADAASVVAVTRDTAPSGRRRIALWEPPPLGLGAPGSGSKRRGPTGAGGASDAGEASDAGGASDAVGNDPLQVWAAEDDVWGWDGEEPSGAPDDVPRRSALREITDLLADLVKARRRTLAFVRSRAGVEVVASATSERLERAGWSPDAGGGVAAWRASGEASRQEDGSDAVVRLAAGETVPVAAYRGGYLPEERRVLEGALREGRLLALATTNALELGIDVAGLDVVLMTGWPGTRVSFWQQAGRAGRAGADGLAVLVAGADPLDTYLVNHPEAILGEAVEATAFDPTNPYVLAPHLCAAAFELPLTEADLGLFGLGDLALLAELERRELLRRRPTGWYWNHSRPEAPHVLTDLRGSGAPTVTIVESQTGTILGTVDGERADAVVHPGAVYVHQGRTFVVDELADGAALVHAADVAHRTSALSARHAQILSEKERRAWGPFTWAHGAVRVTSRVQAYDVLRPPRMEVVGTVPLEMPEHALPTSAVWWWISPAVLCEEAGLAPGDLPGALHAAEHASIAVLPLLATCDRWDIGGISTALHPDTAGATVLVHDGLAGGAGFAERGYRAAREWVEATYGAVTSCPCHSGCPRCVLSPKCGNGNRPIDKAGALRVLELLRATAP